MVGGRWRVAWCCDVIKVRIGRSPHIEKEGVRRGGGVVRCCSVPKVRMNW